jgi:hypothetical protein
LVFHLIVKGIKEDIMEEKSGITRCWPWQSRYRGRSRSLERRGGASGARQWRHRHRHLWWGHTYAQQERASRRSWRQLRPAASKD